MLSWTDEELKEIRDEVFGGCTVMNECMSIEELRKELTFQDAYKEAPVKPFETKRGALMWQYTLQEVHSSRDEEYSCDSVTRHTEAGNFTDEEERKKHAAIKQEKKDFMQGIAERMADFFKKYNL